MKYQDFQTTILREQHHQTMQWIPPTADQIKINYDSLVVARVGL